MPDLTAWKCHACGAEVTPMNVSAMKRHYDAMHPELRQHVPPKPRSAPGAPEVRYSFFNSPQELRLDLGEYVIRIERKK